MMKRIPGDNDADYDDSDHDPIMLTITDGDESDPDQRRSISLTEDQALELAKALCSAVDPEGMGRLEFKERSAEPGEEK